MFSLMSNCCNWLKRCRQPARQVTLVMVGLDNAGKTSTVRGIQGEDPRDPAPTVGFSKVHLKKGKFDVTFFDLGGGNQIRGIWKNYYSESHGVVFVVDSTDIQRIQETRETIAEVLQHPRIAGKPVLVLANKHDQVGALTEADIVDNLSLENLVNDNKTMCQITPCCAVLGCGKKLDKSIKKGLKWLLDSIAMDYEAICERVQKDTAEQRAQEEQDKNARLERIKKIRQERERQEQEEAEREGRRIQEEELDDENLQNPFQPISNLVPSEEQNSQRAQKQGQTSSLKTDGDQMEEMEEEQEDDIDKDDESRTPENGSSGEKSKKKKKNLRIYLKRKHRVDPLSTDGSLESPTPQPPPVESSHNVGWATPKVTRLPKLEPLGDSGHSDLNKKPLPPVANRLRPNGDAHDVVF